LFRTAEREYLLAADNFKRPEDAELEIRLPLRSSNGRAIVPRVRASAVSFGPCIRRV